LARAHDGSFISKDRRRTVTITEALAEIKTITKRLATKREFVTSYLLRHEEIRDPLEKDGGSGTMIARERQAIADLEQRIVDIRAAIARSNEATKISIGGRTRTVTEWLAWRKEVAPGVSLFLRDLRNRIEGVRKMQVEGRVPRTDPRLAALAVQATAIANKSEKPPEIIVNLDEKELAKDSEAHEDILGQLDGQLSLKNATTEIRV
jgi:hypothetical protein